MTVRERITKLEELLKQQPDFEKKIQIKDEILKLKREIGESKEDRCCGDECLMCGS